jgi:pyruvate/2-oxoglutarate dehydrogenase complex dihydrolipoamide acyltransferase (E2) component
MAPNATESAIKFAVDQGVDLDKVTGTGKDGRITKPDVDNHLNKPVTGNSEDDRSVPPWTEEENAAWLADLQAQQEATNAENDATVAEALSETPTDALGRPLSPGPWIPSPEEVAKLRVDLDKVTDYTEEEDVSDWTPEEDEEDTSDADEEAAYQVWLEEQRFKADGVDTRPYSEQVAERLSYGD